MGSRLLYYLLLKPVSLLPYFFLYRVSDFFFFIFITVFRYRRAVVLSNLERAFPDKNDRWRQVVMKRFYRHLADLIVESIKNFSISAYETNERFIAENTQVFEHLSKENKPVVIAGGHFNNWELFALAAADHMPQITMAIYKRLNNKWFDQKMREARGTFGLVLVSTRESATWIDNNIKRNPAIIYGIDQSPADPMKAYWGPFLGVDTAMYLGAESHAKKYDMAVVYGHIQKRRRGYYAIQYELITEDARSFKDGELTQLLQDKLEADVLKSPEYWLWTHKRWKHSRPADWQLRPIKY
jgi:Kdo2-lipid IVA lauroyltransferase/acyltransferase